VEYTRLGQSDLKVSRICLGCMSFGSPQSRPWMLDAEASRPLFQRAIELGINFFDTANVYSQGVSEQITGLWLREYARREDVVVATKVGVPYEGAPGSGGLSRKTILAQIDASLTRLGMDYVDVYQIHRFDPDTPLEETLQALDEVVKAGKARYLGASSMYAWQLARSQRLAEKHGWAPSISMQPQYNLVYREEERDVLPLCQDLGIGVIPWSPLARGFLTDDRTRPLEGPSLRAKTDESSPAKLYFRPADFEVRQALANVADELGITRSQTALAWLFSNPVVVAPIIGATRPAHLEEAASSIAIHLSEDLKARLEAGYLAKPILDH
jgi:aryl-alcohol dehydrogenase-like predicted oxidoreductase